MFSYADNLVRQYSDLDTIRVLQDYAAFLYQSAFFDDALLICDELMVVIGRLFGVDDELFATQLISKGLFLLALERYEEALQCNDRSMATFQRIHGNKDHELIVMNQSGFARVLQRLNRLDESIKWFARALMMSERLYGAGHVRVAEALSNLGVVVRLVGRLDDAKRLFEQAMVIYVHHYGTESDQVATCLFNLGIVLHQQRGYEEASERFARSMKILATRYGRMSEKVANIYDDIGTLQLGGSLVDEAMECFEVAMKTYEVVLPVNRRSKHRRYRACVERVELYRNERYRL